MNPQKAQIKIGILQNLGADLEDQKEALEREITGIDAGVGLLKRMPEKFDSIKEKYQQDLDEGEISQTEAQAAIKAIDLCLGSVTSMKTSAEVGRVARAGALDQAIKTVEHVKKQLDKEIDDLAKLKELLDSDDLTPEQKLALAGGRPPLAVVPGGPAADISRRREAARAEKEAKAEDTEPETPDEPENAEPDTTEPAPVPEVEKDPQDDMPPALFGGSGGLNG